MSENKMEEKFVQEAFDTNWVVPMGPNVNALSRILLTLPRQAEWEAYVSQFHGCDPNATSAETWQLMTQIF